MNRFYTACFIVILISGVNSQGLKVKDIAAPDGYRRIQMDSDHFGTWLRELPLLPDGSPVLDYKGNVIKDTSDTSVSFVVDWFVYGRRHEQCMDIIVRLHSEYLFENKNFEKISYPLPGGFILRFSDWIKGYRPRYKGIDVKLVKTENPGSGRLIFDNYLTEIFVRSHTQQFYHSCKKVKLTDLQPGDFIVKKGTRGHAVLVLDLVRNERSQTKLLIAQGDTPACQLHILKYKNKSSWFPVDITQDALDLPIRKNMTWDGLRRF